MRRQVQGLLLGALVVLVLAAPGCKKKKEEETAKGTSAAAEARGAQKQPESKEAKRLGAVQIPADVLGYGGTASLDKLLGVLTEIVSKFNPAMAPAIRVQFDGLLQMQLLHVTNLDWLDRAKPVYFVVADPQKASKVLAFVFPLKDEKALESALPPGSTEDKTLGARTYSAEEKTVYVARLGKEWAIFATDPVTLTRAKEFAAKLTSYKVEDLLDVQVSMERVNALLSPFLTQAQQELTRAQPPEFKELGDVLRAELDIVKSWLAQAEVGRAQLKYGDGVLALDFSMRVKKGSWLAKFAAGSMNRELALYRKLPGNGWFVMASNLDPTFFKEWTSLGVRTWKSAFQLNEQEKKALEAILKEVNELNTGEQAAYLGMDGEFPLHFVMLGAVKDGKKMDELTSKLFGILLPKVRELIAKETKGKQPEELAALNFESPQKLIASMKPLLAKEGVDISLKEEEAGSYKASVLRLQVDPKRLEGTTDQDLKNLVGVAGNKFGLAIGYDDKTYVFVAAKDPVSTLRGLAKGAGGAEVGKLLEKAPGHPVAAAMLSLSKLLKIASKFDPSVARQFPRLDSAKKDVRVTFLAGALDGTSLYASLGFDVGAFSELVAPGAGGGSPGPTPPVTK